MTFHILLVEDNPLTSKALTYLLEREGYRVTTASTLSAAFTLAPDTFQLALIDVSLPDGNGFDLAQYLHRTAPALPLIFLTAHDDTQHVIRGLELGAKDYISKPFHNRELLLRIKNHLHQPAPSSNTPYQLDSTTKTLHLHHRQIPLTALEFQIFECLSLAAGNIVPRERLLDEIWNTSGKIVNDNTLSVYLKRLRTKLQPDHPIETVKNLGYRLRFPPTTSSSSSPNHQS